jgi:zinc protease
MRLLVVEDHSVPVVAVRVDLGVDETFDPQGKEGLYQVMQSSLREGTTSRTFEQLAEASAPLGTAVSPTSFTTTPTHFAGSLALMADMLMHPSFPAEAIDKRRAAVENTMRSAFARPATPGRAIFYATVEGRNDALPRGIYATGQSVRDLTRDDVMRFYQQNVGPQRTTIIVAGDVTDAAALAAVKGAFGKWARSNGQVTSAPYAPPPAPPTTIYLEDVPGSVAYMYVGNAGPQRTASDAFAAEMMSTIAANRFVQTLREAKSFMYSGNLGIVWRPEPRRSQWFGSTNVQPTKVDSALVEWLAMLKGLRGGSLATATELENARRARVGPLLARTDGPDSVATRLAEIVRDRLPTNYLEQYAAGVSAVTPQAVAAAASKYIDADHLVIVVTGDRKVLEPALKALNIAPVVVVDANGKPLTPATP